MFIHRLLLWLYKKVETSNGEYKKALLDVILFVKENYE